VLAVNAGHTFSNAVTMRKVTTTEKNDKNDVVATRKMKTKMLCQTTDPEEKRCIIGDTFMNVSFLFLDVAVKNIKSAHYCCFHKLLS
jgi:GMP synthase PP-ATPase subunit